MSDEIVDFDALVDILRVRIGSADAVKLGEIHSFRTLMVELKGDFGDNWPWQAYEELDDFGHLGEGSHKAAGGDAYGVLSAEGRRYLRESRDIE